MNYLLMFMINSEYDITIDTETFMNKVHEDINYLVKYMINGDSDITIDTETFII